MQFNFLATENIERHKDMKKYIFYTYEGHTIAPNNNPLDSMQILGFEEATTHEKALNILLKNNPWIVENGFDTNKILYLDMLNSELELLINNVVEYLWHDEKKHYEEESNENHIYNTLLQLKEYIK